MLLLTNNGYAEIDSDDLEQVSGFPWYIDNRGYVVRLVPGVGQERMHRLILGADADELVDHINGNTIDNRRCNLRTCSHEENMRNRRRAKSNRSGFKGVYRDKNAWRAQIRVARKKINLGQFATPEQAHQAYCSAAADLHGEFARFA